MNDDYIGKHRPTVPTTAGASKVIGDARDILARLAGYDYTPRHSIDVYARWDAEERAAVTGFEPVPHYELNDGTCVGCGKLWPCPVAYEAQS